MEFIIENWAIMFGMFALGAAVAIAFARFVQLPFGSQLEKVQNWLLLAVSEAERELGGGTGELKLRKVYDKFLGKFPWLARVISFKRFIGMVRKALAEMEKMLSENKAAKAYVEGSETLVNSAHAMDANSGTIYHAEGIPTVGTPGVYAQSMSIASGSYAPASKAEGE